MQAVYFLKRPLVVQEGKNTMDFSPFISDSAKTKIDKFSKVTNWVKL